MSSDNLRAVFSALDITSQISNVSSEATRFGGMADIYQASWYSHGAHRKVAVKFIRLSDREIEKTMRRHRREIRTWHAIHHPNILPLLGLYWGSRTLPAMVSTWCEHSNIRNYIRSLQPGWRPIMHKYRVLWEIARGLAHLHSHDPPIIHGDLKGDNVLVADDGTAMICDFGLSKVTTITTETMTSVRGTLRWMAPELVLDDSRVTTASDVWAYACVVIEVLSDAQPFSTKLNDRAVLLALTRLEIPPRPLDASDPLWAIVLKCLSYSSTDRPVAKQLLEEPLLRCILPTVAFTAVQSHPKLMTSPSGIPRYSTTIGTFGTDADSMVLTFVDDSQPAEKSRIGSSESRPPHALPSRSLLRLPTIILLYPHSVSLTIPELTILHDLDGFHREIPRLPAALVPYNITHEDWIQCMQHLAYAWSGNLILRMLSGIGGNFTHRDVTVTYLVRLWNTCFYQPMCLELFISEKKTRDAVKYGLRIRTTGLPSLIPVANFAPIDAQLV